MPNKTLSLVGAAQGWGAAFHEVEWGPQSLFKAPILKALQSKDPAITWRSIVQTQTPFDNQRLSVSERLAEIQEFSKRLANEIKACQQQHFPVVLGGDHSVAIGTWSGLISALNSPGAFGLIWIDAHMDAHTPLTSHSKNIHGMPLATLLGHGDADLVHTLGMGKKLDPAHVVLIGTRSYEPEEITLLEKLGVKIFFMPEVKERGFDSIFKEAINIVSKNTVGFGLSLDIDAFDPSAAPGTGTREQDGLQPQDVIQSLYQLKDNTLFKCLEIVEYDPTKDEDHKTAALVQDIILSIL